MELLYIWLWFGIGIGMATDYKDSSYYKGLPGALLIILLGPIVFPALIGRIVCQKVKGI